MNSTVPDIQLDQQTFSKIPFPRPKKKSLNHCHTITNLMIILLVEFRELTARIALTKCINLLDRHFMCRWRASRTRAMCSKRLQFFWYCNKHRRCCGGKKNRCSAQSGTGLSVDHYCSGRDEGKWILLLFSSSFNWKTKQMFEFIMKFSCLCQNEEAERYLAFLKNV